MTTVAPPRHAPVVPLPVPRPTGTRSRQSVAAWILALPFLLLFSVFTAWPVLSSLYMSFTDIKARDLRSPFAVNIVGFENYAKVFSDETFRKACLLYTSRCV